MPADFSTAAKAARLQIAVPPIDIEAIRERSEASGARARFRRFVLSIVVTLGVLGTAAAFAGIGGGVHLWLTGNGVKAIVESFTTVRDPMATDVKGIVSHATFSPVFPVGVPRTAKSWWIAYSPADKPDMITIQYRDALGKPYLSVTLVDNAKIRRDIGQMPAGPAQTTSSKGAHWQIGGETVIAQSRHVSEIDIARIRTAMQDESPAHSQAVFEAALPKIVIEQVQPRVSQAAEQLAPAGNDVLLGKWDIHQIPILAAKGKALRDGRTVNITNIPQVHGRPDYRHAMLQWPKVIAIPADGVRAVAAALRSANIGPNCECAIMVRRNTRAYAVWKIDAKTLQSTRLR